MKTNLDRVERDLAALISTPSITGDEYAVQDVVAELLDQAGMTVERLDVPMADVEHEADFTGVEVERASLPIVAGRLKGARPGPSLMICGHVDVVPPGDLSHWTTPPFDPVVKDGVMFGRGACDMKGGVVAAIETARLVAAGDFAGELIVLAVPSEEDGGAGAYAAIRAGYTADACVITEPSDLDMVIAHGGAITFTLDVPGKAAHASMRREGVSALDNLSYLVEALKADEQARNAAEKVPHMAALGLPYPTIIGQVAGGSWASTVIDEVKANGRYGVTLGQDCDGAVEDLRRAVEFAAAEHDFLADHPPTVTTWGGRFDSASIDADHDLPQGIIAAARSIRAKAPEIIGSPSGADMRLFINQGNTPTVWYGPGELKYAHAADEQIRLADVGECAEVLAEWVTAGR